jgi:hypothetical protein
MRQLTLRIPDQLGVALKEQAAQRNASVNAYVTTVLSAAVDPDLAGDDAERLRARLARAGLLEERPAGSRQRPAAKRVREARKRAGSGRSLSAIVREGRG